MSSQRDESNGPAAIMFRRGWWAMALRGVVGIVLGIMVLTRPAMGLKVFVTFVALYLTCDGVLTLASAFQAHANEKKWWPYLMEGLFSLAVGVLGLMHPGGMVTVVVALFAIRALLVGIVEIGTGVSVHRVSGGAGWLIGLGGVASVAFGMLLLARPGVVLLAGAWIFALYAIAFGLFLDGEAIQSHRLAARLPGAH
ncbi:MAG TPA: DUF308 domain-containing protein [Polyangia bacterium]|nr:DUF308 domain-containing protein [Polyangia bacterium]